MLTPILFAALALRGQAPTPVTGSALISKMLVRYNGAKTLQGTIHTTQTADTATVVTDTVIAYERPSKIRLTQQQRTSQGSTNKLLVSDGIHFAYSKPPQIHDADEYLIELVKPGERKAQTVGDLYWVVATNLPDRSPALDALIANTADLTYFAKQLERFSLTGKEKIGERTVNVIEGDWRESDAVSVSGKFKLYLTDDGDLARYVLVQNFAAPSKIQGIPGALPPEQVVVTTTWDVSTKVDQPVVAETFNLKTP